MATNSTERKITRGICEDFAEAFKKSELYHLYQNHKNELFLGVRNNRLNLYYNCDSIASIEYRKRSKDIVCEINRYYLYDEGKSDERIEPTQICERYETIKNNSDKKRSDEKKAQSKLTLLNNNNHNSNWLCVDVEYVKSFKNQTEKSKLGFNARFDIIALSKEKPHRVAFIELKYGSGAIGGDSGIYKHIEDFCDFSEKGFFESHLKQKIIEIIESKKRLGIEVPFELPTIDEISSKPEFYFITLNNNPTKENGSTPKQTMAGYLFKEKRWDCSRLTKGKCVETDFGDVTNRDNKKFHATFLFSEQTLEKGITINDILDEKFYQK